LDMSDVDDALIENNEFKNVAGYAIRLKSNQARGTNHILIQKNHFSHIQWDAILVGEPNRNVKILNNRFEDVALSRDPPRKHALYLEAPDVWVEGNVINGVGNANGISIRSSGTVRRNHVKNTAGMGIKYFSSSRALGSGLLVIECNILENHREGGIGLARGPGARIGKSVVRFNTLVGNGKGIFRQGGLDRTELVIYGNMIVDSGRRYYDFAKEPALFLGNFTSSKDPGFVHSSLGDYRLKEDSQARGFVPEAPAGLPADDFAGNPFGKAPFDAGAFQAGD